MTDATIQVILTTHNRRDTTVRCLNRLLECDLPTGVELRIILADASSTDGTAQAASAFPAVEVVAVPSDHFWAMGMKVAWGAASKRRWDYLLWLNDDVVVDRDALVRMLAVSKSKNDRAIVVGAMRDAITGELTYSGYRRGGVFTPLRMPQVRPSASPERCLVFNGNLVLVPRSVDSLVGGFPSGYSHGLADYAYGLEAARRGVEAYLAPETTGECSRNPIQGTWSDPSLDARTRLQRLRSPKGLPWSSWRRFCVQYGGLTGFAWASRPYVGVSMRVFWESVTTHRAMTKRASGQRS